MNTTVTTSYKVTVTGRIWSGHKAKMDYTFDYWPTPERIKAATGDFEYLDKVKCVRIQRTVVEHQERIKL